MTVLEWIRDREIRGQLMFSMEDVREAFPDSSDKVVHTNIYRMLKSERILDVYKGFYVIIPPQYALKGVVPPSYYIHNLMRHVGKPYYVALLSASEMYGAAHQHAMHTQVMTVPPRNKQSGKNPNIYWYYRTAIPQNLLRQTNTEAGIMLYSSPELTAVDLVQYANHVGGYQRASTVLAELVDEIDWSKMEAVLPVATTAALQRLGYILEFVLEEQDRADALYNIIHSHVKTFKQILMRNDMPESTDCQKNRWKVNMNITIEIDEL